MTTNQKASPKKDDGQQNTPADSNNPPDSLRGWFDLAKSARINRKQKRGWQRKGGE